MTVAILAEKPSAARKMAGALGGMTGTYQGTPYQIVSARGHLYELAQPEEQVIGADAALRTRLKSWKLEDLPWDVSRFAWKQVPVRGAAEMLRDIKAAFSAADEICIATDSDPSGEGGLIAVNIIKGLGFAGKRISRMYFLDEAHASLQKAFVARVHIPDVERFDEYMMSSFRNAWDFTSMQFTRVATASAAQSGVLRQGRLKSAMVLLVGDQLKAHHDYVKTSMFQNRFRDENGVLYTNPDEPRFATQAEVPQRYSSSAVVLDSKTVKHTSPPRLLDLAALSARLSSKGFSADVVLSTYQKMYEAQVVSYPRTEDKTITTEQFKELLPLVDKIAAVVSVDPSILTQRNPRRTHVKDSGAHGANRPGPKVPASLEELEPKYGKVAPHIYTELARSYLAMLAEDYAYEAQEGHVKDWPEFKGRAAVPRRQGWKDVFSTGDDDDADDNAKGLGTKADPTIHEIIPPRPEHPTMKWLMKQLEKRDVGTGATRTSTYAEVTSAQSAKNRYPLLAEKRGRITMTEFGEMSYRILPDTRIGDLGLTERVFATMKEIAAGTTTMDAELAHVADWVRDDIDTMQRNAAVMRKELGLSEQKQTKEKFEGFAQHLGRHVRFSREWSGVRFTDAQCQALLEGKTIEFQAISKAGKPYDAKGDLQEQTFTAEGGRKVDFIGFKPDFSGLPKAFCGHTFSAEERSKLEAGEGVFVTGMVGKSGKPFDATVRFDKKTDKINLDFGK